MEKKEYQLGGKIYVQKPLVLGQMMALLPLIEKIEVGEKPDPMAIAKSLGPKLNQALGIVILEKDIDEPEPEKIKAAMERLDERADEIFYRIEPEQVLEVAGDFFAFNRVSSIIEKLAQMMAKIRKQIAGTGSILKESSGDSPRVTSPKGKTSSGR